MEVKVKIPGVSRLVHELDDAKEAHRLVVDGTAGEWKHQSEPAFSADAKFFGISAGDGATSYVGAMVKRGEGYSGLAVKSVAGTYKK